MSGPEGRNAKRDITTEPQVFSTFTDWTLSVSIRTSRAALSIFIQEKLKLRLLQCCLHQALPQPSDGGWQPLRWCFTLIFGGLSAQPHLWPPHTALPGLFWFKRAEILKHGVNRRRISRSCCEYRNTPFLIPAFLEQSIVLLRSSIQAFPPSLQLFWHRIASNYLRLEILTGQSGCRGFQCLKWDISS